MIQSYLRGAGASVDLQTATFDVVGVSVAGPSIEGGRKENEDHCKATVASEVLVAVVSDGAGSATRGADGARIVAEEICAAAESYAERQESMESADQFIELAQEIIKCGIHKARSRCLAKRVEGETISSFSATVVGLLLSDVCGLIFHIGDGAASAHSVSKSGLETHAFSPPENGEYANETFFYTDKDWEKRLRFTVLPLTAREVWLMTDGMMPLVVSRAERALSFHTWAAINRWVFESSASSRTSTLEKILTSDEASERVRDDKTLVMVRRAQANAWG